jgi:hypothetical protein
VGAAAEWVVAPTSSCWWVVQLAGGWVGWLGAGWPGWIGGLESQKHVLLVLWWPFSMGLLMGLYLSRPSRVRFVCARGVGVACCGARWLVVGGGVAVVGVWVAMGLFVRWRVWVVCVGLVLGCLVCAGPAFAVREYVAAGGFVSELGSGNGEFSGPTSVAVNDGTDALTEPQAGDVYVLDQGNDRVEWFNAAGTKFEGQFTGSETPAASFLEPEGIAVDNDLLSASHGDVYVVDVGHAVVDRFSAAGKYEGQLTGTCASPGELPPACVGSSFVPFEDLHGVAVDPSGDVWVRRSSKERDLDEFSATGMFLREFSTERGAEPGIAVDAAGNVYAVTGVRQVVRFSSALGEAIGPFDEEGSVQALAVNPASGDLLVDQGSDIQLFGASAGPESVALQTFSGAGLSESRGVAVNGTTGTAYATQAGADDVKIFDFVPLPAVEPVEPAAVSETAVVVHGSIDPEGAEVSECKFEYGTEPGVFTGVQACAQATPFTGSAPVPVSATLTGLEQRETYHFRLSVVIGGAAVSSRELAFYTLSKPLVSEVKVSSVGAGQATISGQLNAGGLASSYRVEYGTSVGYGGLTEEVSVGAPQGPVGVQAQLRGLAPGTTYHFQLVAVNAFGAATSGDMTFATAVIGEAFSLPDSRAYETVSGTNSPNEVYVLDTPLVVPSASEDISTELPVRAAGDGEAVAYVAEPGTSGGTGVTGNGEGNEFLATRDPAQRGWDVSDITPTPSANGEQEAASPIYEGLSPDLSVGVLEAESQPFAARAQPQGPAPCYALYKNNDGLLSGEYGALFTKTATPDFCGFLFSPSDSPQLLSFAGGNEGAAGVAGYSHLLFQSPAALSGETVEATAGGEGNNLYESVGGVLEVVNLLPDNTPDPDATFGSLPVEVPSFRRSHPDLGDVVSADGSRVVWSDVGSGDLSVREDGLVTVAVSAGRARFLGASGRGAGPDGFDVFYSEGGEGEQTLWRFSFERYEQALSGGVSVAQAEVGAREMLVSKGTGGENAAVQGVLGVSDDGGWVYFVADGVLASNANSQGEKASVRACGEAGGEERLGHLPAGVGCNLYVAHEGKIEYIAALAALDNDFERAFESGPLVLGDWQPELGSRTAEVTAGGGALVFQSTQQLTGYDDTGLDDRGKEPERGVEVFVYEAGVGAAGRLFCASCSPSGAPPSASAFGASYLPMSENATFLRRWVSGDGSRVFFDTFQPLVSQDTNETQDVYEWEQEGTAGCPVATSVFGGCVSLISGGASSDRSYLEDADSSGGNVFFTHRGQLGPGALPEDKTDLFDARVDGGFPEVPVVCSGASCEGAPLQAAPVFALAPTVGFSGLGNYPPAAAVLPVKLTRAQLLAKALSVCRKDKSRGKRAACEKLARRRYGPVKAKPKSKPKGKGSRRVGKR